MAFCVSSCHSWSNVKFIVYVDCFPTWRQHFVIGIISVVGLINLKMVAKALLWADSPQTSL